MKKHDTKQTSYSLDEVLDLSLNPKERVEFDDRYQRFELSVLLRERMADMGVSQAHLASLMGTCQAQVSRILSEEYEEKVKLSTLRRVAEALNLKVELKLVDKSDAPDPIATQSVVEAATNEILCAFEAFALNQVPNQTLIININGPDYINVPSPDPTKEIDHHSMWETMMPDTQGWDNYDKA